jgi:hypothetical protein
MKYNLFVVAFLWASCSAGTEDRESRLDHLADQIGKARTYRQERFACAEMIRYTQDTIQKDENRTNSCRLKSRLDSLYLLKKSLIGESNSLADSIRKGLDSLVPYRDRDAERTFRHDLDSLLMKKGYIESTTAQSGGRVHP